MRLIKTFLLIAGILTAWLGSATAQSTNFVLASTVPLTSQPEAFVLADVNGDNKLDVIVAH